MLLYVTAEDVLGDTAVPHRKPQPLHTIPPTLSALYDMGMRHHIRSAALLWPSTNDLEAVPDWRLDRMVIRIALYCREKLQLEPGARAVIFGQLGPLWPAAEFALLSFGATAIGIEHDVRDDALATTLRDADPRVVFVTDDASASRLAELRARDLLPRATFVGAGANGTSDDILPLRKLLDLAGTLDTAERAHALRVLCREVEPECEAFWHVSDRGVERLTHAGSIERVAARFRARPPAPGDLAYLQPPRATLAGRLALAAFVGDGLTTVALGRNDATDEDILRLQPHAMRVAADWLEAACTGTGPRWPVRLDRHAARRRLRQRIGNRVRWVETERPVDRSTAALIAAAGARVVVD